MSDRNYKEKAGKGLGAEQKQKGPDGQNIDIFETMPAGRAVRTMALPAVAGQLVILGYNLADTYFLGKANSPAMIAAAALILPVYNIAISLAGLAGAGGGSLMARLMGKKEGDEAARVCSFSIYLGLLLAALFAGGSFLFMRPILALLGAGQETYGYAADYMMWVIVFGAVPTVLSCVLSMLLRSAGESKKAGIGIILGGLSNIALDAVFVYLLFPEGKEIIGVGAATVAANVISCVYFFLAVRRLGKESVLRLLPPQRLPAGENLKSVFSVGIPYSVATLLFDLNYVVLDRLMASYGESPLAALGIVLKLERFPLNIGTGICQGMMPIVAYSYSSQNFSRMKEVKNYAMKAGLLFAGLSIVLFEVFADSLIRFFIGDAKTVQIGAEFLRIRAWAAPLMFLSFFHVYLFNGVGKGGKALLLGVMRWLVFNLPILFLMNALLGSTGLVWAQAAGDVLTVLLSVWVYERFKKGN